jgi:DNA-directed RNA polymerase subunit RPC12/RpoP
MATFCNKCGTQNKDDQSVFCSRCGAKLIRIIPEDSDIFCSRCGAKILDRQSVFCDKCGSRLFTIPPLQVQQVDEQLVVTQQVAKKKKCPACGEPIEEENRYYCRSCGAYLRGIDSGKVSSIGRPSGEKIDALRKGSSSPSNTEDSYKSNGILTVAFFFVLFLLLLSPLLAFIFIILSAIAVYQDAKEIGAGSQSKTESMDTLSWSPVSWGLIVLLVWIVGHPLYLIKRREIFNLNNSEVTYASYQEFSFQQKSHHSGLYYVGWGVVGLLLILILIGFISGMITASKIGSSIPGSSSDSDTLVTQNLQSMALTINDMPNGWTGSGSLSATGDTYSASFVKPSMYSPEMVKLNIQKFPTIDKAKTEYNSLKAQAPDVKIETVNLGNEGFGYAYVNDIWVIFRRGNILVKRNDVKSQYDFSLTTDDAKEYANIVANRIK